jgi:hypothetical protein
MLENDRHEWRGLEGVQLPNRDHFAVSPVFKSYSRSPEFSAGDPDGSNSSALYGLGVCHSGCRHYSGVPVSLV